DLKPKLRNQLFEAALTTAKKLEQTCLFKDGALERTLQRAVHFYVVADPDEKQAERLLSRCWEAYSILGQASILEQIIKVQGESTSETESETTEDGTHTGALFLAAVGLSPEARLTLARELNPRTAVQRKYLASAQDYAHPLACWLATSLSPLVSTQPM